MDMKTLELREQVVGIGSRVAVRDVDTGEYEVYTLVEPAEADIAEHRISSMTPVAHALYGRTAGDVVEVAAPGGLIRLHIESVHAATDEYG